jgi:glycosyltransferase involved in cell wall biosynthesis
MPESTSVAKVTEVNLAAQKAKGTLLFILTSGADMQPGCVAELLRTYETLDEAAISACHLQVNNLLWFVGGNINRDGTLSDRGYDIDPNHYSLASLCDVDFCPLGSLLISHKSWENLGGLKEEFATFNYAFADACLRLRRAQHAVLCQPLARIVNTYALPVEDPWADALDRRLFRTIWDVELTLNPFLLSASRSDSCPHILFVDHLIPEPDKDAGSAATFSYVQIFLKMGYRITFVAANSQVYAGRYTDDLRRMGVICPCEPISTDAGVFIEENCHRFDVIMLFRVHTANQFMDVIKRQAPDARIIFNTVDLHFLREERQALFSKSPALLDQSYITRLAELNIIARSDCSIVLSQFEYDLISSTIPEANVSLIPIALEIPGRHAEFGLRNNIVFIGGFLHRPNVDSIIWFTSAVWPEVLKLSDDISLLIVGSNAPPEVKSLHSPNDRINFIGQVENLDDLFHSCRLSVAPLRYGSGIKGKIITSLAYGVPCVATPEAAEGMGLKAGAEIIIASDPSDYAHTIVEVYNDRDLWYSISDQGLSFAEANFSIKSITSKVRNMLETISAPTV